MVKEWTFAGDVVRAMLTLVEQDDVTEAVIGSGEGHSIAEWAERCFAARGPRLARSRAGHERPGGYPRLISRPARLRALGWRERISFGELASMMMAG